MSDVFCSRGSTACQGENHINPAYLERYFNVRSPAQLATSAVSVAIGAAMCGNSVKTHSRSTQVHPPTQVAALQVHAAFSAPTDALSLFLPHPQHLPGLRRRAVSPQAQQRRRRPSNHGWAGCLAGLRARAPAPRRRSRLPHRRAATTTAASTVGGATRRARRPPQVVSLAFETRGLDVRAWICSVAIFLKEVLVNAALFSVTSNMLILALTLTPGGSLLPAWRIALGPPTCTF